MVEIFPLLLLTRDGCPLARKRWCCRPVAPSFCWSAESEFCPSRVRCEFPLLGEDSNPHCWAHAAAPRAQGSAAPTAPLTPVGNRLYWRHMRGAASYVQQATSLCCLIRLGHKEKKEEKQRNLASVRCLRMEQSLLVHNSNTRFEFGMFRKDSYFWHSLVFLAVFWRPAKRHSIAIKPARLTSTKFSQV